MTTYTAQDLKQEIDMIRKIGIAPRLHPNGFIQLDLGRTRRLNIWPDPKLSAQKTLNPIHDHAFSFVSTCLVGRLLNFTYHFDRARSHSDFVSHALWMAERIPKSENTVLIPLGQEGTLRATDTLHVEAGQTYRFPTKRMHDSVPVGLTATVMTKEEIFPEYRPVVAVPIGKKPDNDFSRYGEAMILWGWVDKVMSYL